MSAICLCFADIKEDSEKIRLKHLLGNIAKSYDRGVYFNIDWCEPIVELYQNNGMVISLTDKPNYNNCEMLLLPDGWFVNGRTNKLSFNSRIEYIKDVVDLFIKEKHCVELILGCSGMMLGDFVNITIKNQDLVNCLNMTIGKQGVDVGLRISITPD